ncbi:MAG: biotin synthase BioB [SAR324 cluster bacterium]|nr:biotin synthase BioB [SAR324 cluster bacterium]
MQETRHNWTLDEVTEIYNTPLMDLIFRAATIHRENHPSREVQKCTLLSIKTGGCTEDCGYCPQSARHKTSLPAEKLMSLELVVEAAKKAREHGSSRFCMGAAWRNVKDNSEFDRVLEMVTAVNKEGLEVCCTLGMLNQDQADKLAKAGLAAYNHNLDTSEDYYSEIISTRTYNDRIKTIKHVQEAGISVCTGGIIGMGESHSDRIGMLFTLANLTPHPESVPVNALVPVKGTPLENQPLVAIWEMIRMVATARIIMPKSTVRLSAGRTQMSMSDQALCFLAGANSIFAGEKLLTTPNPDVDLDQQMFDILGLVPRPVNEYTIGHDHDHHHHHHG